MYPIELTVPKAEQEFAIRLGARWNEKYKVWYVPRTLNVEPLSRWFTAKSFPNLRSRKAWLARVLGSCPYCGESIALYGLMLPSGHQVLCPADEEGADAWEIAGEASQLYEVDYLSASIQGLLHVHAPTYRLGYSTILEQFYWMNHCSQCGELIEDDSCAMEFGSPLNPLDESMAEAIVLKEFQVEFEISCGSYSCGVQFIESMKRIQA
jgi:hypothetical protein